MSLFTVVNGTVATMSSAVSQYVTKVLCGNEGSLEYKQLEKIVGQKFTVADSVLYGILYDWERFAIREGRENASGRVLCHDSVIVAKTSLRVCQSPPGECTQCENLHLCRYFVCGNCRFGDKCKNIHSLDFPKNTDVLRKLGLHDIGQPEVFQLLLQNDSYLMPEICSHYNKGVGEHGSCRFKTSCTSLHVCLHYLQGDCTFGEGCKRAHVFDATAMKILNGRGFSQENISTLHKIYQNKFIIISYKEKAAEVAPAIKPVVKHVSRQRSSSSVSDSDRNEICLYFIRGHCSFDDKCVRTHYHLPYKWQILESDGVTWKDLPNMEEIEKAYCKPANDSGGSQSSLLLFLRGGSQPVNFITMTSGTSPVRRLSTVSSVTKPPHYVLTTRWIWYWEDVHNEWKEYGDEGAEKNKASVSSQTLENTFQTDPDSEVKFESGKHKYILYFKEMNQRNILYKTKRSVRRRPRFVSEEDVKAKRESTSSSSVSVPPFWDNQALSDSKDYTLVPLSSKREDYQKIQKLFKQTMTVRTIHSIKRIQNLNLWRVFQWQKEQMMKKNGGKMVDERHLFHGTDESIIDAICEQNFDWRACGLNGTLYGEGSYFARDASYSHNYIKPLRSDKKNHVCGSGLGWGIHQGEQRLPSPPSEEHQQSPLR
ncbi:hypothetical protein UPYG_G00267590 [Umbra pygmaea]|uniref:Poly [ADP-ribose] polymerase 12 n=1 Tax=Umbra pygmaea TaxID=75934 RepID=A0ABD0WA82_UMBPY